MLPASPETETYVSHAREGRELSHERSENRLISSRVGAWYTKRLLPNTGTDTTVLLSETDHPRHLVSIGTSLRKLDMMRISVESTFRVF